MTARARLVTWTDNDRNVSIFTTALVSQMKISWISLVHGVLCNYTFIDCDKSRRPTTRTLSPAEQRNMNIWIWTVGCLLICNDFRVQTCSNIDLQKSNCLEVYFVSMKAKGWYNWSLLPGIITSSHPQTCNYEFETLWVTTMKPHLNTTMQNSTNKFNLLLQFCRHEPSPPNPGDYWIDKGTCFRQKLLNDTILILNDHI